MSEEHECDSCYEQATTNCDGFAFCQKCCEEHMARIKKDSSPSPTVTVPREEWERMRAAKKLLEDIAVAWSENGRGAALETLLMDAVEFSITEGEQKQLATPGNAEETQTTQ